MSEEPAPPRAVVIGHGGFASGLISAVDQITGRGWMLIGVSNTGMTPADMEAALCAYADKGIRVVFTDLPAGSATICAKRVSSSRKITLVSGVNLPALLEFVVSADASEEDAIRAAERGRASLAVSAHS